MWCGVLGLELTGPLRLVCLAQPFTVVLKVLTGRCLAVVTTFLSRLGLAMRRR